LAVRALVMTTLRFGELVVQTSGRDKILFPDEGITKGEVIDYYSRVAETALPHLADRFLTLQRFPDGIGTEGFFQQARQDYFPPYITGTRAPRVSGGDIEHISVSNAAGLVYLADQAVITIHAWLSCRDRPDFPDRMVFDLDPPADDFGGVRKAAKQVGQLLRDLGLAPFVMTTGSRGLHVVSPIDRSRNFAEVRSFARRVAEVLAARHPDSLTTEQRKSARKGRLYLDIMRNAYGQTAVAPYSLRARPGAPVATPLDWDELDRAGLTAQRYCLRNLFRRLGRKADPWQDIARFETKLHTAERALEQIDADTSTRLRVT